MRRAGILSASNDVSFGWHLVLSLLIVVAGMVLMRGNRRSRARDFFLLNLAFVVNVLAVPAVLFFSYGRTDHSSAPASAVIAYDWLEDEADSGGSLRPSALHLAVASDKLAADGGRLILSGERGTGDLKPIVMQTVDLPAPQIAIDGAADSLRTSVERAATVCRQMKLKQISVTADFQHLPRLRTLSHQDRHPTPACGPALSHQGRPTRIRRFADGDGSRERDHAAVSHDQAVGIPATAAS